MRQDGTVKIDIDALSRHLAGNVNVSDADMGHALRALDDELCEIRDAHRPIPIDLIFTRAIVRRARLARDGG